MSWVGGRIEVEAICPDIEKYYFCSKDSMFKKV